MGVVALTKLRPAQAGFFMPEEKHKVQTKSVRLNRARYIHETDAKFWGYEENYADVGHSCELLAPGCSHTKPAPTYD